ncbi:MAG: FecR domain-containing protein, partial [Fibrobacter sp.]|nr:FecR domain-containing protein [Fibrobacter sp.]
NHICYSLYQSFSYNMNDIYSIQKTVQVKIDIDINDNLNPKTFPLKDEIFIRKGEIEDFLCKYWAGKNQNSTTAKLRARKTKHLIRRWSMAASITILLAWGGYRGADVVIYTEAGEQSQVLHLPDGSRFIVMANSKLCYNRIAWFLVRDLRLTGRAEFEVKKGKRFTVATSLGKISVLGTKFEVEEAAERLLVVCREGRVKVETVFGNSVINAGESVNCDKNGIRVVKQPEPKEVVPLYVDFRDALLGDVMGKIESLYSVSVVLPDFKVLFTGSIPTTNLDEALEVVCGSCDLDYEIDGETVKIKRK